MTLWDRIAAALSALASGESLAAIFDRLRAPPERSVAFTIAVIGLGAKMAKADGRVTRDEVAAFRDVFTIPEGETANAARVFDLARQDVAGYEEYARRIKAMFDKDEETLCDLVEGLFHIALADGDYHSAEDAYLRRVAEIFEIAPASFRRMRARFVPDCAPDPHDVLGVAPDAPLDEKKRAWRRLVRETHPDRMIARGVPAEAVQMAQRRLVAINEAWEQVSRGAR
ncbi:molecular chaperone DjiA [Profundibacterium mesophilum]|uniref:Molecular chaperone DnaJ family protein n=1 Tax=Profundibacterium mesophilum KAUST100406-0324 TaxID=1037889 RepID=A0A921NTV2_9RHOB|nr:molecular chaperone DjiA [Profundibacterium mesophilum]KAF0675430.1 Molecular chaperone DnaJ family protein [Profundibacterium mesophilum KAUST100406-0324]